MSSCDLRLACLLLSSALLPLPALAADMPGRVELPPAPALETVEFGLASGWYLRGDIGYVMNREPEGNGLLPDGAIRTFESERLGKSVSGGLGIGYKFNNWFRADVTGDIRSEAKFRATNSGTGYSQGFSIENAKLNVSTVMANGYLDLGTWSGITPYVGAGVGVAMREISNWNGQSYGLAGFYGCGLSTCAIPGATTAIPKTNKTSVSWALMTGVTVGLSQGFALDFGYRYIDFGDISTKADLYGVSAKVKNLTANEIRMGVRYTFQ